MRSDLALLFASVLLSGAALAEPLVGPAVGNADLLVADGMRLYNEQDFPAARDSFLKATRAAPATLPTYLSLARAWFALEDFENSCQAYKTFVRSAPDSPDRDKAENELRLCERRLAAGSKGRELGRTYVNLKAAFFEAHDKGVLVGEGSASEQLRSLLAASYAAPDLGDMAGKLAAAAAAAADGVYEAALSRRKRASADELRRAADLYRLALDCGAEPRAQASRIAFLQGLALIVEGNPAGAEPLFAEAAAQDPSNREAAFHRGLARYLAGDKAGALKALRANLPDDPRTAVLGLAAAFDIGPAAAASELERFLFERRFEVAR